MLGIPKSLINNFSHVVESIVIQKKGQLVAMVHFNREELEQRIREFEKADYEHRRVEKELRRNNIMLEKMREFGLKCIHRHM